MLTKQMARINQELLRRLRSKLKLSQRQVYRLIERKMQETHLERHVAAIVVASDNRINIAKYASRGNLADIRGAKAPQKPAALESPAVDTVIRRVVKTNEPIVLDLTFVANMELRAILERDVAELNVARSQGLEKTAKTCMVLSGSIAEALLLDRLSQNVAASLAVACSLPPSLRPRSTRNPEDWGLSDMINVAVGSTPALLPDDASTGAHQLRRWRNLIHPARELRDARDKRIKPTKERARNAIGFLQFIARELGR